MLWCFLLLFFFVVVLFFPSFVFGEVSSSGLALSAKPGTEAGGSIGLHKKYILNAELIFDATHEKGGSPSAMYHKSC